MKKLGMIMAFVAFMCFGISSAMAQNTNPAITNFVQQYFPQATVQMVMPDEDDIDVILNDYTKIEFRLNHEWKKVDCEHATTYTTMPAELVPEQITAYVNSNFQGATIKKLEKKYMGGWEIELSNGIEIEFDKRFNVIDFDD